MIEEMFTTVFKIYSGDEEFTMSFIDIDDIIEFEEIV